VGICHFPLLLMFQLVVLSSKSHNFLQLSDKELDIVEMAVYGDVIRPGNQCRCRTVAEMLGQYKSKNHMAACKLPYNDESL
jgi:hypothetical protein